MAGISKAEREARAAAAAAAEQGGVPPQDSSAAGQSTSNEGADEAAALQEKADAEAAAAAAAAPAVQLVNMTRDANAYPAPHTADVHPAEVDNFAAGGWQVASD